MTRTTTILTIILLAASTATAQVCPDETFLALEVSGELTAPPALEAQIAQDLAAIRSAHPVVADIHIRPDWDPYYLWVRLTEAARQDWVDGVPTEFDSLNAVYGVADITSYTIVQTLGLHFATPYHMEVLAGIYESLDCVVYADSSGVGGDGDDITSPGPPLYTFKNGEGDCSSGCTFEEYWEFSVTGGSVTLLRHYVDGVTSADDQPGALATRLGTVSPNPFNPATAIAYHLAADGRILLRVHDVRGRPVADLVDGFKTAGDHEAVWRGVDRSGRPLPSGVYYCRLTAGDVVGIRKMTLLK